MRRSTPSLPALSNRFSPRNFAQAPLGFAVALILVCTSGCTYHSNRLAGVGAVTGAIAGAAIGKDPKAAAIGAGIGGMTGAAVGGSLDEQQARNEALIAQRMGQSLNGAVTHQQVVAMTQAGLSDAVITTHINTYGVAQPPHANDLIALRQAGVSDAVLNSLQTASVPRVAAAPPVILEEHIVSPVVHVPFHHCPPRYRHRSGVHWGFSFSN